MLDQRHDSTPTSSPTLHLSTLSAIVSSERPGARQRRWVNELTFLWASFPLLLLRQCWTQSAVADERSHVLRIFAVCWRYFLAAGLYCLKSPTAKAMGEIFGSPTKSKSRWNRAGVLYAKCKQEGGMALAPLRVIQGHGLADSTVTCLSIQIKGSGREQIFDRGAGRRACPPFIS
nr:hypothetical protein CFP56_08100 [Quercus suber]